MRSSGSFRYRSVQRGSSARLAWPTLSPGGGRTQKSLRNELVRRKANEYVVAHSFLNIDLGLGDRDQICKDLEVVLDDQVFGMALEFGAGPFLDYLDADPQFNEIFGCLPARATPPGRLGMTRSRGSNLLRTSTRDCPTIRRSSRGTVAPRGHTPLARPFPGRAHAENGNFSRATGIARRRSRKAQPDSHFGFHKRASSFRGARNVRESGEPNRGIEPTARCVPHERITPV